MPIGCIGSFLFPAVDSDGKETMMEENNEINEREEGIQGVARYNPNRPCFLSEDGRYYCYEVWNSEQNRVVIERHEIGKDGFSEEWTLFLDSTDHDHDLNDRYQDELKDPLFQEKLKRRAEAPTNENGETSDPWDDPSIAAASPELKLFAEPKEEDPKVAVVRDVVEKQFTDSQKAFYYDHFGADKQIEEIRQEEGARTGKLPTAAAMTNRKNKMLDKVAKALGTTRVKRHKYPKK